MFLFSRSARALIFSNLAFLCVLLFGASQARADATLLLEEPYSYDGEFAGTGHTAVYLSRVCADSPTVLRRCNPGESGVVISRYHHVGQHDWYAIPLIPYLYAVEDAKDIPLYVDADLVAFLRKRYLEKIGITDKESYQLAGSAYDRTSYGFRIETTPEQDDKLIAWLNSEPNTESYKLLKRNCADFAKQIVNFYYPHAIHRSIVADLGVSTPKQGAKTLVHSAKRHPEMQLTTFLIPQVPGLKRSKPVHGVLESLVLAKKYVTPVLLFHPVLVGGVEAAYWAGWRFNPAKGALIFSPSGELEQPLTAEQRKWYLKSVTAMRRESSQAEPLPNWAKLQSQTQPELDLNGRPALRIRGEDQNAQLGICRDNALRMLAPPELVEGLMFARLEQELKPKNPSHISQRQIEEDLALLHRATKAREASLGAGALSGTD